MREVLLNQDEINLVVMALKQLCGNGDRQMLAPKFKSLQTYGSANFYQLRKKLESNR
jgi:hypothetical protein